MSAASARVEAFRLVSPTWSCNRRKILLMACIYGMGLSTDDPFCPRTTDAANTAPAHAANARVPHPRRASWKVNMMVYYEPVSNNQSAILQMPALEGADMSPKPSAWIVRMGAVACLLAFGATSPSGQYGTKNGEWRAYAGDPGSTKYSPLDQINRDNAKTLRIAWRYKTDNLGPRADFNMEATPIMVNGVLYTQAGARRDVVALDPMTGEQLWMWRMDEGKRGASAPRQ